MCGRRPLADSASGCRQTWNESASAAYIFLEDSGMTRRHRIAWYLWPFAAIWRLIATIVGLTGRFVAMVVGLVFIIVGVLISLTVIGAIVGIPMAIIGLLLFLKGIF
jgi:hypothetical protein